MTAFKKFRDVISVLQDKESWFAEIDSKQSNRLIGRQLLIICLFGFIYGLVMGSYHSTLQSMVAGLKMMVLFITTLLICFPSFFIVQQVLGSKMSFRKMVEIVLSGFVLASTITLSFLSNYREQLPFSAAFACGSFFVCRIFWDETDTGGTEICMRQKECLPADWRNGF
jgi:hypothetical protein